MDARDLPRAIKLIMEQHGWTQDDLAGEWGVSQSWVSKLIKGQIDTKINKIAGLLARVGWEVVIRPKGEESDPVKRRDFNSKITATAASVMFVPSPKCGPYQDPEYVRNLAGRLGQNLEQIGGIPLASIAFRHIRQIAHVVKGQDRDLLIAASDLARTTSRVLFDAQRIDQAEEAGILALTLARRSNYVSGAAHCHENLCTFNLTRDPLRGAHYVRQGMELPDLPEEHQGRMAARLGSALARARLRGNTRALDRASRSAINDARNVASLSDEATAVILGSAAISLSCWGHYAEAEPVFDEVIAMHGDRPLLHADWVTLQIKAALNAAEPSPASQGMQALARVLPLVTSERIDTRVREIYTASARWANVPEVRDARDQIRTVATVQKRAT